MPSRIFCLMLLSFSLPTFAHVNPGFHHGKTPQGQTCFLHAGETTFLENKHHPLNERIQIRVGNDEFTVGHPPHVDLSQSMVAFNHDLFEGILPTSKGAKALLIEMVHEANFEGPKNFHVIEHDWKANRRSVMSCLGLRWKGPVR